MPVGTTIDPLGRLLVTHFEPYVESRSVVKHPTIPNKEQMMPKFQRQGRVQIISAGRDRDLGRGGPWPLRFPEQSADRDNLANFAERRLGTGQ